MSMSSVQLLYPNKSSLHVILIFHFKVDLTIPCFFCFLCMTESWTYRLLQNYPVCFGENKSKHFLSLFFFISPYIHKIIYNLDDSNLKYRKKELHNKYQMWLNVSRINTVSEKYLSLFYLHPFCPHYQWANSNC